MKKNLIILYNVWLPGAVGIACFSSIFMFEWYYYLLISVLGIILLYIWYQNYKLADINIFFINNEDMVDIDFTIIKKMLKDKNIKEKYNLLKKEE